MTPDTIAAVYCSGDLPFRPRYLNRLFALRLALRSPVNAVRIAMAMPNEPTRQRFVIDLEAFAASPLRWRYHEIWMKRKIVPVFDDLGIDTSEIPEVGKEWFDRAKLRMPRK